MKKLLCAILTITICVSLLVSCSQSRTPDSESTGESTSVTTVAPDTADIIEREVTPLMWKASDAAGHTLWLLGSVHVGYASMSPLPDYVLSAYNASDALAVEADVLAATQDMNSMLSALQTLIYQDGTTITDHLPDDIYSNAKAILTAKGMYNASLDMYKPVMWMTFLESLLYSDAGLDENYGIDMQLLTLAHDDGNGGKEIQEIESIKSQYDMLSSFSDELQTLLLKSALEVYNTDDPTTELTELVDAWCSGNLEGLQATVEDDTSEYSEEELALLDEYNKEMLDDRNLLMSDFAECALTSGKQVFLCVGTAHMLGDNGIVETLKARGYTVEISR